MKHYDIVVEANELPTERKTTALTLCIHALDYYQTEKDVAMFMKKNFDKLYGPIWQCIVGHEFGMSITHDENCFIYIHCGEVSLLLYRCTD
ncbi:Dynein light chain 2, cytoplasmic [Schistosoma japonicum]|uniref:Dynein light chain n=2 Tax=Schistosoma TaxID=6181 RepID=A0A4Z2CNF4_SCHJA|nr:Dynein light chain 2, cytoplasmic [Schistosoma japonicum]KAK4473585.1 hypothetical protein MN116_002940 [Schistosoma mekongi]TNN05510.1 Dynein light chain 2, cytoplasmic [Schistosoma japonicum]